jgi:hypothetical protein
MQRIMTKTILAAAIAGIVGAGPLTPSPAEAAPKFCKNGRGHPVHGYRWCVEKGFSPARHYRHPERHYYRDQHVYGRSAWDVVRRDPCRMDAYRRFAAEHKNPYKRQRFIERVAREGCSYRHSYYYAPDYGPYAYGRSYGPMDWFVDLIPR